MTSHRHQLTKYLTASRVDANDSSGGFFTNATAFTMNQPVMFDMQNAQFYQMTYNTIVNGPTGVMAYHLQRLG